MRISRRKFLELGARWPAPAWRCRWVVPPSLVSVMVTSAGLQVVRGFLVDGFPAEGWATTAPGLLWPVWGVALGAGTLAYYYRRRGRCVRCGRGEDYHSLDA